MNNIFTLEGNVALVTGSSTGIGAAIASSLAAAGADVVCHGQHAGEAEITSAAVRQLGRRSLTLHADLSQRDTHDALVEAAIREFGKLDILVNNAGIIRRAPAVEFSDEDWDAVLALNLSAAFRLARCAGRHMLLRGSGKVVNIASLLAFQGGITVPAYAASKGGIAQLTKALANEWAHRGVNVNAIAPGYIATANTLALRNDATRNRQILERIPAARWGNASDIGGAAAFLCMPAANYVHGHVLVVDGGWLAR